MVLLGYVIVVGVVSTALVALLRTAKQADLSARAWSEQPLLPQRRAMVERAQRELRDELAQRLAGRAR